MIWYFWDWVWRNAFNFFYFIKSLFLLHFPPTFFLKAHFHPPELTLYNIKSFSWYGNDKFHLPLHYRHFFYSANAPEICHFWTFWFLNQIKFVRIKFCTYVQNSFIYWFAKFFWKNFWIGFVSSWPCSFHYPLVPSIHLLSSIAPVPNP